MANVGHVRLDPAGADCDPGGTIPGPPITIQNPDLPPDQLRWLLKPLTREELVMEANAWRDLLKGKVARDRRRRNRQQTSPGNPGELRHSQGHEAPRGSGDRNAIGHPNRRGNAVPRAQLLSSLDSLREERSALMDRSNVVLTELKAKGGEVAALEHYRDAVSEIIVDVTDTSALWTYFTAG